MDTRPQIDPLQQIEWKKKSIYLPDEMLLLIFSFLRSPKELEKVSRVCKTWKGIAADTQLWQKFNLDKEIYIAEQRNDYLHSKFYKSAALRVFNQHVTMPQDVGIFLLGENIFREDLFALAESSTYKIGRFQQKSFVLGTIRIFLYIPLSQDIIMYDNMPKMDIILGCVDCNHDLKRFQQLLINNKENTDVLLLYAIRDYRLQDLIRPPNTLVFKGNDNANTFFTSALNKAKDIADIKTNDQLEVKLDSQSKNLQETCRCRIV